MPKKRWRLSEMNEKSDFQGQKIDCDEKFDYFMAWCSRFCSQYFTSKNLCFPNCFLGVG